MLEFLLIAHLKKSLRELKQVKHISLYSAFKATKLLGLTPYKIQKSYKTAPNNPHSRLHYCQWLKGSKNNTVNVLDTAFFSDEAWFHLSGYVYSQNSLFWSTQNLLVVNLYIVKRLAKGVHFPANA